MNGKMKFVIAGVLALLCAGEAMAGTLKDSRDGKSYKTVKIGQQTWMAENLNYSMENSYCNPENNCGKGYGRLYAWVAAQKACPSDWHLPSEGEFNELKEFAGGSDSAGIKLMSKNGWNSKEAIFCVKYGCSFGYGGQTVRECSGDDQCLCGNGESICLEQKQMRVKNVDRFGFSVLPAGAYYGDSKKFSGLGELTSLWASSFDPWLQTPYFFMFDGIFAKRVSYPAWGEKERQSLIQDLGFSVRCLQDDEEYKAELEREKARAERQKAYDDSVAAAKEQQRLEEERQRQAEERQRQAAEEKLRLEKEEKMAKENAARQKVADTDNKLKAKRQTFKDPRDGQVYATLKIGKSVWMVENLRYEYKKGFFDNGDGKTWCYKNDSSNCQKYGRLYNWEAAMKSCPKGWRLPTTVDFTSLKKGETPFNKLASKSGWNRDERDGSKDSDELYNAGGGLYKYGFAALPAGYYNSKYDDYWGRGGVARFWSSTEYSRDYAYNLYIFDGHAVLDYVREFGGYGSVDDYDKTYGYSVRCVQDSN